MIGYVESIWINCNKINFFNLDGDYCTEDDDNEEGIEDVDEPDEEKEAVRVRQNRLKRRQLASQRLVHSTTLMVLIFARTNFRAFAQKRFKLRKN